VTHERDDNQGERDFAAYLEGDSEVSQSYARLKGVAPPEALDQAILAQARAAADETRGHRHVPFWASWSSRIAAVAIVTLAVAVTLRLAVVPDERSQSMERDLTMTVRDREAAFSAESRPQNTDLKTVSGDRESRTGSGALSEGTPAEEVDRIDPYSDPVAVLLGQSQLLAIRRNDVPEALPEGGNEDAARQLEKYDVAPGQGRVDTLPSPMSMQADIERPERSAGVVAPPAVAETAVAADEAVPTLRASPADQAVPPLPASQADEAVPTPSAGPADEKFAGTPGPDSPEGPAYEAPVTSSGASSGNDERLLWRADPKGWLEYVDRLIEDEDDEAVRRELAAFREDWPDIELAERYETWLGDPAE